MIGSDVRDATRRHIRALIDGAQPDAAPEDFASFRDFVAGAHVALEYNGAPGVTEYVRMACNTTPAIRELMYFETPERDEHASVVTPPLPSAATEIYQHLQPCAFWLDRYAEYASRAAPMTPRSLHVAAALFVSSTTIARRLCLKVAAKTIYPNLFFIYIAPPGLRRKSTGIELVEDLLVQADLRHLALPENLTPQRMIEKMSVPEGSIKIPPSATNRAKLEREKAFAAQRAWIRDEVSGLFTGMRREFNTGLLEMILKAYDCARVENSTVTRGDESVERTYLSLFGASNPVLMAPHLADRLHWHDGMFSRFAMLQPTKDEPYVWRFYEDVQLPIPADVIRGVRAMYELFPEPEAEIQDDPDNEGQGYIVVRNIPDAETIRMAPGVFAAWEVYSKATGFDMIKPDEDRPRGHEIDDALHANYARFGTHVIKVAMNLAVMDAAETGTTPLISMAHYARAQQIVEAWRVALHELWSEQSISEETALMKKILQKLKRGGMTLRDLQRATSSKSKDVQEVLDVLQQAGKVTPVDSFGKNGVPIRLWQLVD